jgi:hypothetical protein
MDRVVVTAKYTARCGWCGEETSLWNCEFMPQSPAPCSTPANPHAWVRDEHTGLLEAVPVILPPGTAI